MTPGKIVDMGIKDANNMGAAMAPAALEVITLKAIIMIVVFLFLIKKNKIHTLVVVDALVAVVYFLDISLNN